MKRRSLASQNERPLIGVTTSEVRPAERVTPLPEGEPRGHEMALGLPYLKGVEAAGGLPVVIPPLPEPAIESLLDRLDGVLLSGGPDLDPENYDAEPHPELGPTEPDLDRFELAVARSADAREMPILAICRGAQAINIVRGGALHQHLPDLAGEIPHRQDTPGDKPSHEVTAVAGSRLALLLAGGDTDGGGALEERIGVNSFHHQAIERLGENLVVSARAPDGTIEAIEDPARPFLVGVQWHAETLTHRPYEAALFRGFIDASRREAAASRRRRSSRRKVA